MAVVIDVICTLINDAKPVGTKFRGNDGGHDHTYDDSITLLLQHPGKQVVRAWQYEKLSNDFDDMFSKDFDYMFSIDVRGDDPPLPPRWSDLGMSVYPSLIDQNGYTSIPRIEYTDASRDVIFENLTLENRDLFPLSSNSKQRSMSNFAVLLDQGPPSPSHRVKLRTGLIYRSVVLLSILKTQESAADVLIQGSAWSSATLTYLGVS
ncbi:hypothetical protein BJ912DRAFT_1060017 [Pholiota molesta]|nr:hypothetical protein BJ912DRAFT_1060017 [Pholiota molesta]